MKRNFALCSMLLIVSALIAQYWVNITRGNLSVFDASIRYFSYFTILSNILVAIYFALQTWASERSKERFARVFHHSALVANIIIVALVYNLLLRRGFNINSISALCSEIFHIFTPIAMVVYWYFFVPKTALGYGKIWLWCYYPAGYLLWILLRGHYLPVLNNGVVVYEYPYWFIDVNRLGAAKVGSNIAMLTLMFILFYWGSIALERYFFKKCYNDRPLRSSK